MHKRVVFVLLFAVALAAGFAALRFKVIEPDDMGTYCSGERMVPMICRIRAMAIQGFARHLYGPISMTLAVLGWIGGSRYLGMLAMTVGMAGSMLYDFEFAGAGLLLGAMLLVYGAPAQQPQQTATSRQT